MGATRNTALSELNLRGISINVDDSNTVTIVPSDSGVMFINKNTKANTNYVLPTTIGDGDGKMFWFLNVVANHRTIITAPASTLVMNNTATASNATSGSDLIGHSAIVVGDGSKYYLFEMGSVAWTQG